MFNDALEVIAQQARCAQVWYPLAAGMAHLCSIISGLEERIEKLEERLAKLEQTE